MSQKLSAMNYVRNNKKRVGILITSLALCFLLFYITDFLTSTTEFSFRSICLESTRKTQYVRLVTPLIEGKRSDEAPDNETHMKLLKEESEDIIRKLEARDDVKAAFFAPTLYTMISPLFGGLAYEIPLLPEDDVPTLLSYMEAELIEGKLPENPGELVLDTMTIKNNSFKIGSTFNSMTGETYTLVGVIDCDYYFGCGIPMNENEIIYAQYLILSESITDAEAVFKEEGIEYNEERSVFIDVEYGKELLETEVVKTIADSTSYVYVGIIVIMTIAIVVLYTSYLRDRHNEWCLYSSIGFSRKSIYSSIMREILITFAIAVVTGAVLTGGLIILLNAVMIEPKGMRCSFFNPETLGEILCVFLFLTGILQIPVGYALNRIQTIDAMDDDLY